MNRIETQWISPAPGSPRQMLGASVNTAEQVFEFTVPAHVLAIYTVILAGDIRARSGPECAWQACAARHALGSFTHSVNFLASPGSRWVSIFMRADSWALLSGRDASHFTNRLFGLELLAEARCEPLAPFQMLAQHGSALASPAQLAGDLLRRAEQDLRAAARRHGTHLLNQALAALERSDLPEVIVQLGVHERRLQRVFRSELGMPAKLVQRIARLHRTVKYWNGASRGEQTLAGLAHAMGYTDQAHLAREFRLLAGYSASQLKRRASSDENLLWALREGARMLAPGIFGQAPD